VKNSLVLGHCDYHYQHEEILYGWTPGPGRPGRGRHQDSRWFGDHAQSSLFFVDRPTASETHPTIKPLELIARMLQNSSLRGDLVVERASKLRVRPGSAASNRRQPRLLWAPPVATVGAMIGNGVHGG
jgi:DNA modification methylase